MSQLLPQGHREFDAARSEEKTATRAASSPTRENDRSLLRFLFVEQQTKKHIINEPLHCVIALHCVRLNSIYPVLTLMCLCHC